MMTHDEIERLIDQRLKRLPTPQAPASLLPRVQESIRQREVARWYGRRWTDWPLFWQAVSLASVAAVLVTGAGVVPGIQAGLLAYFPIEGSVVGPLATLVRSGTAVAGAAAPLWRVLIEPIWGYFFLVALMMGTSCAAIGAALRRVTLGGAAS